MPAKFCPRDIYENADMQNKDHTKIKLVADDDWIRVPVDGKVKLPGKHYIGLEAPTYDCMEAVLFRIVDTLLHWLKYGAIKTEGELDLTGFWTDEHINAEDMWIAETVDGSK